MWREFKGIGEICQESQCRWWVADRVVIPSWLKPKSGRFRTGDSIMDITQRQFSFMLGVVSVIVSRLKDKAKRCFRRMESADNDANDEAVTEDSRQLVEHRVILFFIGY